MFLCCKISLKIIIFCFFILPYETHGPYRSEVFTRTAVIGTCVFKQLHLFWTRLVCKKTRILWMWPSGGGGLVLFRLCAVRGWQRRKASKRMADICSFLIWIFRATFIICEPLPTETRWKGQFEIESVNFNPFVLSIPI